MFDKDKKEIHLNTTKKSGEGGADNSVLLSKEIY